MSKCAGTELEALLRVAMLDRSLWEEWGDESLPLPPLPRTDFVISSVRNPCSYYPSLWAYQSKKKWAPKQEHMHEATFQEELFDLSGTGNASTGIADFAHWLRSTQLAHGEGTNRMDASIRAARTDPTWPTPHKGIMSLRFYEILAEHRSKASVDGAETDAQLLAVPVSASASSKRRLCSGGGLLTCAGNAKYKELNLTIDTRLLQSDWHNNVDCWVVHGVRFRVMDSAC
jgi:hypothetical protein